MCRVRKAFIEPLDPEREKRDDFCSLFVLTVVKKDLHYATQQFLKLK